MWQTFRELFQFQDFSMRCGFLIYSQAHPARGTCHFPEDLLESWSVGLVMGLNLHTRMSHHFTPRGSALATRIGQGAAQGLEQIDANSPNRAVLFVSLTP